MGKPVGGCFAHGQPQLAVCEALAKAFDLQAHDFAQFFPAKTVEDDLVIQAVEKLRTEVGPQGFVHPAFHFDVLPVVTPQIENRLAADVAGEDQHCIGEVNRSALTIGDATVIEDLKHHVEHIGVSLLHLIEEDHCVRTASHRLRQLAAGLVAHVTGRGTDQAADAVLLHVFRHVDSHHGVFAVEQL